MGVRLRCALWAVALLLSRGIGYGSLGSGVYLLAFAALHERVPLVWAGIGALLLAQTLLSAAPHVEGRLYAALAAFDASEREKSQTPG